MAVEHALGELMANAIKHAYAGTRAGQRTVAVDADLDPGGDLVCTVRDTGRWQTAGPSEDGGRGLALVRGLVDSLRLESDAGGTTARFRHRLGRPAQLLAAVPVAGVPGPARPRPETRRTPAGGRTDACACGARWARRRRTSCAWTSSSRPSGARRR